MKTLPPADMHGTALVGTNNWVTRVIAKLFCRHKARYCAYLLYQYLRTVDDFIDDPGIDQAVKARFLNEQYRYIRSLYSNIPVRSWSLLAQIANYDRCNGNVLKDDIMRMLGVFEFDIRRKGTAISADELKTYSVNLARSYTGILLHFIDPGCRVRDGAVLIAHACHMAHMLRDHILDSQIGYLNIAREDLEQYGIVPERHETNGFRRWVKSRTAAIEKHLDEGKRQVLSARSLRIILIARLYCFRYEIILRRLKENDYVLQQEYKMRITDVAGLVRSVIAVSIRYLSQRLFHRHTATNGGLFSS